MSRLEQSVWLAIVLYHECLSPFLGGTFERMGEIGK